MLTGAVRAARAVERAGRGVVTGIDIAAVACVGAAVRGDVGMSVHSQPGKPTTWYFSPWCLCRVAYSNMVTAAYGLPQPPGHHTCTLTSHTPLTAKEHLSSTDWLPNHWQCLLESHHCKGPQRLLADKIYQRPVLVT